MKARHTFVATGLVALLALAGVTAAIAADPAGAPPPRIAFLANGIVPADALAAGPVAGQLGAPVFTTQPDSLSAPAAVGLDDHAPELVIVLGGPVAISDAVVDQVADVTGLAIGSATPPPSSGIVRAAGPDRFATAKVVADLLAAYDPAYLGVDLQAIDADLLDGLDSSAFQPAGDYLGATEQAADSDKLDGQDATDFLGAGPIVTTHGGANWMISTTTAPTTHAPVITATSISGDGGASLAVDAPNVIGGVEYGLESFELCFVTDDPGYIDLVSIYNDKSGPPFGDQTDRTSPSISYFQCDVFPDVDVPVAQGITIYVEAAGGGIVQLGYVRATWTPEAAL